MRPFLLHVLVLVLSLPSFAADSPTRAAVIGAALRAPDRHLVLVYDVTGGTLTGMIHLHLTVYSDGQAGVARGGCSILADPQGPGCQPRHNVDFTFVGPDVVSDLRNALLRAGANRIRGGQPGVFIDSPLHTVTFFRGHHPSRAKGRSPKAAVVSRANTFSFFDRADPEVSQIVRLIEEFMATHFPSTSG